MATTTQQLDCPLVFYKGHALSNDFMILLDPPNRLLTKKLILAWADRKQGIGFDQLLLLTTLPQSGYYRYQVFNSDGQQVGQCINGSRCAAELISTQFGLSKIFLVGEDGRKMLVEQQNNHAGWCTTLTVDYRTNKNVIHPTTKQSISLDYVELGNPHGLLACRDRDDINWQIQQPWQAVTEQFENGINLGFYTQIDQNQYWLEVIERGAGKTQACGSAACALAYTLRPPISEKIVVEQPGGTLSLYLQSANRLISCGGEAILVYQGLIEELAIDG